MSQLESLSLLANYSLLFTELARSKGFRAAGEIDRFLYNTYADAVRLCRQAERPRGTIFVLEPATAPDVLGDPANLKATLLQLQTHVGTAVYSLSVDLHAGHTKIHDWDANDRRTFSNGVCTQQMAQQFSRVTEKCVIWSMGVSACVYLGGELYIETPDVIEQLPAGFPSGFQSLSWKDGEIVFDFAEADLNDTGTLGIWRLPEKCVLLPKPEIIMSGRLANFLRYRMAGYHTHYEEAHVENEGRADICLHLVNGKVMIVEVKWIGHSLIATKTAKSQDEIKAAINANRSGWFTTFDETCIPSGVRQLVTYYNTGRFNRAYLAVFDCRGRSGSEHCCISAPVDELGGHSEENFRILRAHVDPRSASVRARTAS